MIDEVYTMVYVIILIGQIFVFSMTFHLISGSDDGARHIENTYRNWLIERQSCTHWLLANG